MVILKTDNIYKLFLIFLCEITLQTGFAANNDNFIDIVFDLDWTLVSEIENDTPTGGEILDISGKKYRLDQNAKIMLEQLSDKPNVRISFYSGGDEARNIEVLKEIILSNKKISAFDLAYKVLSKNDMDEVSKDPNLRFSERYKKNLKRINNNLDNVVLIDDVINFTPEGQTQNLLWLGPTFNHYETYELAEQACKLDPQNKYIPKNRAQWKLNRDRLIVINSILDEALQMTHQNQNSFVKNVQSVAARYNLSEATYNRAISDLIKKDQAQKVHSIKLKACLRSFR